ncbi:hydrolase [Streptomyces endophytica]|uniref:Hydrolase n=1 Tax=Streptomyces endophytica TaxID=2991496 RepID=A0ABY6PJM3_9ACTN|nr:hydrolase [Streptomyces endophytica]UZJ33565.1 hydrolase [Streptomyces endophytica]
MSLWTSLEPASATVDPGSSTTVRLKVRNTGDIVDEYRFEPVGALAPWTTVEPQTLRLYPGTTGTVELTFAPPRTPDATAGPNPYAVRITPTEHPDTPAVPEGNLTITPFTEIRAELVPPTVKGRFRGRPQLAVDNLGNTKVTASLSGSDTGDRLSYDLQPANVQIEPGRAAFVKATLRPRQITWFGSKQEQPYALSVRRSGADPMKVDGTYVQRGVLPGWLATSFGLLLALTIAFITIWLTFQPQLKSAAREKPLAGHNIAPTKPSAPISSAPPQPEAKPTDAAKPDDSGGGDGGGGEEQPEKPQERTAATAVRELVAGGPAATSATASTSRTAAGRTRCATGPRPGRWAAARPSRPSTSPCPAPRASPAPVPMSARAGGRATSGRWRSTSRTWSSAATRRRTPPCRD